MVQFYLNSFLKWFKQFIILSMQVSANLFLATFDCCQCFLLLAIIAGV